MLITVMLIIAILCFGFSAAGVASRVNLTAAGLAFLTIAILASRGTLA